MRSKAHSVDLNAVRSFLTNRGWRATRTSRGFDRFAAPPSLGFPPSFNLFLPAGDASALDKSILGDLLESIADAYGLGPQEVNALIAGRETTARPAGVPPPSVWFHFDGSIADDHRLSLRTLGKTTLHLQSAIDRAYLDVKYGSVFKHQRLKKEQYSEVEFVALQPEEGGFILEAHAKSETPIVGATLDRLNAALIKAYEKEPDPAEPNADLARQASIRAQVFRATREADEFGDFLGRELGTLSHAYGERSINKEIDQILSLIRIDAFEDSIFELSAYGTSAGPKLTFDARRAVNFHKIISQRRVGPPLRCVIQLRSLDAGRPGQMAQGKATNLSSGKECNMLIPEPTVFGKLAPHLRRTRRRTLSVVACPLYEYGAWDPKGGDIVIIEFLEVISEK